MIIIMNTFQENFQHNLSTIEERLNLRENIGLTSYYSCNDNIVAHFNKIEYYKYLSMVFLSDMMEDYNSMTIDLVNEDNSSELLLDSIVNGFSVSDDIAMIHIINYRDYTDTMKSIVKKMINNVSGKVFIVKY